MVIRHTARILVTEPEYFTKESLKRMARVGEVTAKRMSRREMLQKIKQFDAIVVRIDTKVDREILARATNLKCVVSATTGLNHIDTAFLTSHGIPLFSLHGSHSVPTAEHAIAMLLAAGRRIPFANNHMHGGGWNRWEFIGIEFTGKTLGILGIGRIGTQVGLRARGLQLNVIAYDPYVSKSEIKKRGAQKVGWKEFLKKSDFFTLHAPLTDETRHMFGKKEFAAMKRSALFINTARGEIVEDNALLEALSKKKIRAAAVDVYADEPLSPKNPLRKYARTDDNLILTPHIAASTEEAVVRASNFAAESIEKFFRA